jgi:hypothetical protein
MWSRGLIFFVISVIAFSFSTGETHAQNSRNVFIVTDKPYYCSGEIIRFKAFTNESVSTQTNGVLFVDFWDEEGNFIKKYNLRISNYTADGEILLSRTLATGNYTIRVYSKFSNGSDEHSFSTPVLIVNTSDYSFDNIEKYLKKVTEPDLLSTKDRFSDLPGGIEVFTGITSINTRKKVPVQINIDLPESEETYNLTVFARYRKFYPVSYNLMEGIREYLNSSNDSPSLQLDRKVVHHSGMQLYGEFKEEGENSTYRMVAYSVLGDKPKFGFEYTNKEGAFSIDISDTEHDDVVYFSTLDQNIQGLDIKPQIVPPSELSYMFAIKVPDKMVLDSYVRNYLIRNEIMESYTLQQSINSGDSSSLYDTTRVYSNADNSYDLDTYNEFVDVPDMVREILPYVKLHKKNKKYSLYIYNRTNPNLGNKPLFLVNGLPTRDQDFILNMDVSNIQIVELMYSKKALIPFGWLGRDGVLALYTREPVIVPNIKAVNVNGVFKSSGICQLFDDPDTRNNTIPYFQPSVFWNPEVTIRGNETCDLEIFTGDETGILDIFVVGMDKKGNILTGIESVTIEYQQ